MNHQAASQPHQFIAHRGLQNTFPENTYLSIQEAILIGARYIEMDVQFSRDGEPILYHDETLSRVSDHSGKVSDFNQADLVHIPAFEPKRFGNQFIKNKITPLSHITPLLTTHKDVHFYIELKDEAIANQGTEYCLSKIAQLLAPYRQRFTLIGFDQATITRAKQHFHFVKTGLVLSSLNNYESAIASSKVDTIFMDKRLSTPDKLPAFPCESVVYEIVDPIEADRWLNAGINKIESFAIDQLLAKHH